MNTLLDINDVSFVYHSPEGETKAIDRLNFSVKKGEFVSIIGPSGCGETTILSLIAGLIKPTSGQIRK